MFDVEPLPLDHPLRKMDNVVLTPHLGYVAEQNYRHYFAGVVEDIRGFLDGKPVRVMTRSNCHAPRRRSIVFTALPIRYWIVRLPRTMIEREENAMSDTLIDLYCHIYPDRFLQEMNGVAPKLGNIAARLRGVTKMHDLDARFREMDEYGDYRQVISLPNPPIEDFATGGPD